MIRSFSVANAMITVGIVECVVLVEDRRLLGWSRVGHHVLSLAGSISRGTTVLRGLGKPNTVTTILWVFLCCIQYYLHFRVLLPPFILLHVAKGQNSGLFLQLFSAHLTAKYCSHGT